MKKLTIIMVARNQMVLTQRAIESLVEHTDPNDYKLLFFDNGGTDHSDAWVIRYCKDHGVELKYHYSLKNRGFNVCVNQGYDMCDTPYSLTSHNDVKFCKQWLPNMMRRFIDPEVAAVGPMISFAMGPQSYNWRHMVGCDVKYLLGLFFLADMNVIREVKAKHGEYLSAAYGVFGDKEELEFCYRILQLGFKFEIARDVQIEHEGEKTYIETMGSAEAFHAHQEKQRGVIDERLGKEVVDQMLQITMSKPIKIMIGILTRTEYIHYRNVISLLKIWGGPPTCKSFFHVARGHPSEDRNQIVREFLKTDYTHLLFVDDDQLFEADAMLRLIEHDVDVCTGITWQRGEPHAPCVFIADHENKALHPIDLLNQGLVEVDATGGYFLLIKRHVLESMEFPWFKYGDTSMGYTSGEKGKEGIGEDLSFGLKARAKGWTIWCDSDIIIPHLGREQVIDETFISKYKDSGDQAKFFENKFKKI